MPDISALTLNITNFANLAGAVFVMGIALCIAKKGWGIAKGYFFEGASMSHGNDGYEHVHDADDKDLSNDAGYQAYLRKG
jgi:hypothetical protein